MEEREEASEVNSEKVRLAIHIAATLEGLGVQIPWLGVKGTVKNKAK
jgi:RNase P/RNase MRP subunit POP5